MMSEPVIVAGDATVSDLDTVPQRVTRAAASRWIFPLVGALVALPAAFLRLVQINAVGINSDEAVYIGQAASIAGDAVLQPYFPVFRAHPLLFQAVLSLVYSPDAADGRSRVVAAVFGLGTVMVTYLLGSHLYGRRAGVAAALLIAVMPYHVIVSRQALLDGPMTLFATVTLYLLARFAGSGRSSWLFAAGGAMGLAVLSKETSIVLLGAIFAFFALAPEVRIRLHQLVLSTMVLALVIAPFPLLVVLAGRKSTGEQFLAWQLFRRPNHGLGFYATTVPVSIGWLVLLVGVAGLWFLRHQRSWREKLLLCWVAVPVVFFTVWPVKGFQYLLPLAPVFAVLAGRALDRFPWERLSIGALRRHGSVVLFGGAVFVVAASLAIPSWAATRVDRSGKFLAGSGGVPGGREAARWLAANTPAGSQLVTVGPSMANILQFYGHRKVFGLSVSPNPLHRNPVYEPVVNPDLQLRTSEIQYLVWDSFSASRSPFFARKLRRFAERYNGRVVHTESVVVTTRAGRRTRVPMIIIYAVRP